MCIKNKEFCIKYDEFCRPLTPYKNTHFRPGQVSEICPTGLQFNSSWDGGVGSGPSAQGYGHMDYTMTDTVQVPSGLGRYILSWRWGIHTSNPHYNVIYGDESEIAWGLRLRTDPAGLELVRGHRYRVNK